MAAGKKRYLAVYDYGTGGVWAPVDARSSVEIIQRYPVLIVKEDRPAWMDDNTYERIAVANLFDIDDPPPKWLADAVKAQGLP